MNHDELATLVHFVELAGPDARTALTAVARAAATAGATVEWLAAEDQDDLWLLVVRGAAPAAPKGARIWRFRSVTP